MDDDGERKKPKLMSPEQERLDNEQAVRVRQAARELMEQQLQQEHAARVASAAASQVALPNSREPPSTSSSGSSNLNTGLVDVRAAATMAQAESEHFARLAQMTATIANNNSINLDFIQSASRVDMEVELARLRGPLEDWANEIRWLANNPRLLQQYRPETIALIIRQGQNSLQINLADQQSRDRFNNLLGYIQTRGGEAGRNFVSALRTVLNTSLELIPTAAAAAGMGLTFRAASWINAPLGTALVPANMGFTQRIFNATAGTAQRLGATMGTNPLLAPGLMVGFTLALIYSLPVRYQRRLNRYTRNFLIAVRSGSIEAINAAMSLLLSAIDKLYQVSSIGFLTLCRGAIGFGRGVVSGARNVFSVVASSASALGRAARCINPSELISISSAWMTGNLMALRTSGIDMFAYLTSVVVTEVSGAYQLNEVLSRTIMRYANISDADLGQPVENLSIEDIDRQFDEEEEEGEIQDEIDDGNTLFDGALAAAAADSNNHDDITEAIRSTITSAASSRQSTRQSTRQSSAASSQSYGDISPQRPGVSIPALSAALLVVRENPAPSGETVATITVTTQNGETAEIISEVKPDINDIDVGGGRHMLRHMLRRKSRHNRSKRHTKKRQYKRRQTMRRRQTKRRQRRYTKKRQRKQRR